MKKHALNKVSLGISLLGLLWLSGARPARAQFTQNRETRIDTSNYPVAIKKNYNVFVARCGECHSLDRSYRPSTVPLEVQRRTWSAVIKEMRAKASSHINNSDVQSILAFFEYDAAHQKAPAETSSGPMMPMMNEMVGKEVYVAQGCDTCHTIAGKGGSIGPDLSEVGSRLSREQMAKVLRGTNSSPSGVMPPLPPDTSEQQVNDLIEYLQSLKR